MAESLIIKDGYGATKSLTVESSSYGFIPVHYITSSLSAPIVAYAYSPPVTTVTQTVSSSFVWNTIPSGTFALATANSLRRGLTIFNPGPYNLYVAFSTNGGGGDAGKHGFTLVNTASAPSVYSFIIYPSGTYTADSTTVGVYHGGYFISGSASAGVYISAIS